MTHKIIKTDNYLLVVDDSVNPYDSSKVGKPLAHLPLNNSPILEGVDLLPPYSRHQEDGLEELAEEWENEGDFTSGYSFKAGYNKAREKYKYTEEDLENILLDFIEFQHPYHEPRGSIIDRFIKQLNTSTDLFWYSKYPKEFECEMITIPSYKDKNCNVRTDKTSIKKITTVQGTQWVGKYK